MKKPKILFRTTASGFSGGGVRKRLLVRYTLTPDVIVVTSGLVSHDVRSIPLRSIQSLDYRASLKGRLFNYGTVTVNTAGRSDVFRNVTRARAFARAIDAARQQAATPVFP